MTIMWLKCYKNVFHVITVVSLHWGVRDNLQVDPGQNQLCRPIPGVQASITYFTYLSSLSRLRHKFAVMHCY